MMFEPIAIIGCACLVPGANTPTQFWQNILNKTICLRDANLADWGVSPEKVLHSTNPYLGNTSTLKGGYIDNFYFDYSDYNVSFEGLDQLFQWVFYVGVEAIKNAQLFDHQKALKNAGIIMSNLLMPSNQFTQFAETNWLNSQGIKVANNVSPMNRFMSTQPLHLLANTFNMQGPIAAIDVACASSLYAFKLACEYLQSRRADLMLVGGVNGLEDLFSHLIFNSIQALSKSGQCKPLSIYADGIIPAQGANMFVIKRLTDAVQSDDHILGIVRGIGLSNDGQSSGFVATDKTGQLMAMQRAYVMSGIMPHEISWVECHATGTQKGDFVEMTSMAEFFTECSKLHIGALKANIGHMFTASAGSALLKVLYSFSSNIMPPTLFADEQPDYLKDTPFILTGEKKEWQVTHKIAGINAFGFGGNNAHLIVESHENKTKYRSMQFHNESVPIAIVGIGVQAAQCSDIDTFIHAVNQQQSQLKSVSGNLVGQIDSIDFSFPETHFSPAELKQTKGQQLLLLKVAQSALQEVKIEDPNKCNIYIGLQTDFDGYTQTTRWHLPNYIGQIVHSSEEIQEIQQQIGLPITSNTLTGILSNIAVNRLNQQFNIKGASYCLSNDELSGTIALETGCRALHHHEADTVLIGAVDMGCEMTNIIAMQSLQKINPYIPGDAAVVFILKRLPDAIRQNDKVYALIEERESKQNNYLSLYKHGVSSLTAIFGHAHACVGLLHVLDAVLHCYFAIGDCYALADIQTINQQQTRIQIRKYIQSGSL